MHFSITEIRLFQSGNIEAFEGILRQENSRMLSFVRMYIHSLDVAEDIVQNIWVSIWNSREKLKEPEKFESWIYQIARRRIFDEIRSRAWLVQTQLFEGIDELEDLPDQVINPRVKIARKERMHALNEAIRKLPKADQEILALRFKAQLKIREISDTLNLPSGTVYSQLRKALDLLKNELEQAGYREIHDLRDGTDS